MPTPEETRGMQNILNKLNNAMTKTEKVSQFGSTPCKASYRCTDCLEPFDYFKCI